MHTINIVEAKQVEFNAFKLFDSESQYDNKKKLALAEQLQTSLDINELLDIFAREASKLVDFSGLYFKNTQVSGKASNSRSGKQERSYQFKLKGQFIGKLTYALNSPISLAVHKKLTGLHQLLLHPLKNAIAYSQLTKLAMEDSLTGIGNRRYYDQQIKRAMHHAHRTGAKVGLIVCDLNKFKSLNDTHGHQVGDQVLEYFARALEVSVRDSDSLFRFGGDEFVIIVEQTSEEGLKRISNRLQHNVANCAFLNKYHVSCSLGHALMTNADSESELFERADEALYDHKRQTPAKLNVV